MKTVEKLAAVFIVVGVLGASGFVLAQAYGVPAKALSLKSYRLAFGKPHVDATSTKEAVSVTIDEVLPDILTKSDERFIRPFDDARRRLVSSGAPFLEVNFSRRQINYYDGLGHVSTTTIKTVGDSEGWGGTPAGLYSVLDRNRLAFSASAEAYMPMAVHFYGKYFIHGEPYYPSGEKILSDVSGGCVQVKDEAATAVFNNATPGTPMLVVDKNYDNFEYPKGNSVSLPTVTAGSFLIADLDSGEILAEKNSDQIYPIASITKLMTAIVVAEHTDLRKYMTASPAHLEAGYGGTADLVPGGSYRLVELMYPLFIESSNDSAEVLTGFLGRERTLRLMNEKAKHLFMTSTTYTDPSGYDTGNKSSARDLYLLGRYIVNNRRPILDITKGKKVTTFGPVRFSTAAMQNKNEFEKEPSFIGGKTGFILASRYTGLFLFNVKVGENETRRVGIVVLKSESLKDDTEKLKNWIEAEYKTPTLTTEDSIVG